MQMARKKTLHNSNYSNNNKNDVRYPERKLKIGIFGTHRGQSFIKAISYIDCAEVCALCDKNQASLSEAAELCGNNVKTYSDFDSMLDSGIDAVILANYFTEHAKFAIKALKRGIAVLSETIPAATMAECVELCRTVEQTGALYVFAENYPYMRGPWELKRINDTGVLGKICFAEGEYVHPEAPEDEKAHAPDKWHWRRYLPTTYYSSHSLAPLMFITGAMPERVCAMCAQASEEFIAERGRERSEIAGIMLVYTDTGAVFRINGSTYLASRGNWYRIAGEKGAAETVRGNDRSVTVRFNSWSRPDKNVPRISTYEPLYPEHEEQASKCTHSGSDYWITKQFIDCLDARISGKDKGAEHFLNVYRAAAISAVGILGWRSALNGGMPYDIPDFTDEGQRRSYENDDLTPFPTEGSANTLPYTIRSINNSENN